LGIFINTQFIIKQNYSNCKFKTKKIKNTFPLINGYINEWDKFYSSKQTLKHLRIANNVIRAQRARLRENIDTSFQMSARMLIEHGDPNQTWYTEDIDLDSYYKSKRKWLNNKNFNLIVIGDSKIIKKDLIKSLGKNTNFVYLSPNSDWHEIKDKLKSLQLN